MAAGHRRLDVAAEGDPLMPARFRRSTLALAVAAACSAHAGAVDYVWLTGNFGPGVAPSPLSVTRIPEAAPAW